MDLLALRKVEDTFNVTCFTQGTILYMQTPSKFWIEKDHTSPLKILPLPWKYAFMTKLKL